MGCREELARAWPSLLVSLLCTNSEFVQQAFLHTLHCSISQSPACTAWQRQHILL